MLELKQLSHKIIIDQHILSELRMRCAAAEPDTLGPSDFLTELDSLLSDHLRGIEFAVKRQLKNQLIENHFKPESAINLTYFDIAKALVSMDLPTKQLVSNFQNWILMSTEFALSFEEVVHACLEDELLKPFIENSPEAADCQLSHEEEIAAEPPALMQDEMPQKKYRFRYGIAAIYLIGFAIMGTSIFYLEKAFVASRHISFSDASSLIQASSPAPPEISVIVRAISLHHGSGYPSQLAFQPVNEERLLGYLRRKNSLLADEPYFKTLMRTAAAEDVNPLLLIAITGQEQGFVKKGSENAALIVNNPFNVYTSWIEYNTNLSDAAKVASQTIRAALADRPKGENAFQWLNRRYAEDKNWWRGVQQIYLDMDTYVGPYQLEPR